MEVALTWNLLVIIFFVIIMSYSYIVGLQGTIKIILSTYIALLAAHGIGNLAAQYLALTQPLIKLINTTPEENIIILKIFVFVIITLTLVLKGGFFIDIAHQYSWISRFVVSTVFGFLSAGLILSTLLVFVTGFELHAEATTVLQKILQISEKTLFVRLFVDFYNFWFAAPAIAFVGLSLINPLAEGEQQ